MKKVSFFLALGIVAMAAVFAGCTGTSPEATPTPTPAQTTPAAPTETTPAPSIEPEPTDEMPTSYQVTVSAQKDPINHLITVTFDGGMGQENVKEIKVTVTRSDGEPETQTMTRPSGKSLSTGESVEFAGTAQPDRIEAWATMDRPLGADGKTVFKVYDEVLPRK